MLWHSFDVPIGDPGTGRPLNLAISPFVLARVFSSMSVSYPKIGHERRRNWIWLKKRVTNAFTLKVELELSSVLTTENEAKAKEKWNVTIATWRKPAHDFTVESTEGEHSSP